MKIHTLLLLMACLVSACANQAHQPNEAIKTHPANKATAAVKVNPSKNSDAVEFLTFAENFSNLPADAQKQTLIETNQALTVNPNDILHRMKLVMVYGLPSSSFADTPKAQQLLQIILQEDILANSQLAFANLLFDHLLLANKPNKNSNGDPKRLDSLQQKNDALQQKLEATQQKLESAQQKLDELKKIEQSMGEREATPRK